MHQAPSDMKDHERKGLDCVSLFILQGSNTSPPSGNSMMYAINYHKKGCPSNDFLDASPKLSHTIIITHS